MTNSPLIKIFRFPTQISILISQICLLFSSLGHSILKPVFIAKYKNEIFHKSGKSRLVIPFDSIGRKLSDSQLARVTSILSFN